VAHGKIYAKEGDKCLNIIITLAEECEWRGEGEIINCHLVDVNFLDETEIGDHLIGINYINKRLSNGSATNAAHVESINIIPPINFF